MTRRRGMTTLEVITGLTMMAVVGLLLAQVATWSIAERAEQEHRERATLLVENLIEEAKTRDYKTIEAWAATRKLPPELADRWPQGTLQATVKLLETKPRMNWLTITAKWNTTTRGVTLETGLAEGTP